jgi:hypothetical protein
LDQGGGMGENSPAPSSPPPAIVDLLTALQQVQAALRINAEMQRQLLPSPSSSEQPQHQPQQQQQHREGEEGGNDPGIGSQFANTCNMNTCHQDQMITAVVVDDKSDEDDTNRQMRELQRNLQRLVQEVRAEQEKEEGVVAVTDRRDTTTDAADEALMASLQQNVVAAAAIAAPQPQSQTFPSPQQMMPLSLPTLFQGGCGNIGGLTNHNHNIETGNANTAAVMGSPRLDQSTMQQPQLSQQQFVLALAELAARQQSQKWQNMNI